MKIWVDPPSGWRYGFPKVFDTKDGDMYEWLTANGYSKEVRESYGEHFYVRQWVADEKDVST
jgi:hypothetical protein